MHKPLIAALAALTIQTQAGAASLTWDAVIAPPEITEPITYHVYIKGQADADFGMHDAGAETTFDLVPLALTEGAGYEAFVRSACDTCTPAVESLDSNHVIFTLQSEPVTVVVPPAPTTVILKIQ